MKNELIIQQTCVKYSKKNLCDVSKTKYHTGALFNIQVSPHHPNNNPTFTLQKSVRVGPNPKLCYLKIK
jgi:hypothetical protein